MKTIRIISFIIALVISVSAIPVFAVDPCDVHTFGDWVIDDDAGCLTDGTKSRTCTVCGYVEHDVIPATGHNNIIERVAPTCTEAGYVKNYCANCGTVHSTETLAATGHREGAKTTYDIHGGTDAGTWVVKCVNCGETMREGSVASTDARVYIELSEPVQIDEDHNSVTATVKLANNPGLWSLSFYLYYDEAFYASDVTCGDVFTPDEAIFEAKNIVVANDAKAKALFGEYYEAADGRRAICFYADSSNFVDKTADGSVLTVTFRYASDLEGSFDFGFVSDVESDINSNSENVDVIFAPAKAEIKPLEDTLLIGDVNVDGKINLNDLADIKKLLAGAEDAAGFSEKNADINQDGKLNINDLPAIKILLA